MKKCDICASRDLDEYNIYCGKCDDDLSAQSDLLLTISLQILDWWLEEQYEEGPPGHNRYNSPPEFVHSAATAVRYPHNTSFLEVKDYRKFKKEMGCE